MPENITFDGENVVISELYQACAPGDRCIVVDTNCGFCCNYTAVNARYETEFNQGFDKSCRKFKGNYCSCFDLSSYPSCVEGKCQLVDWPAELRDAPRPVTRPEPGPLPVETYTPPAPAPLPVTQPAQSQQPQEFPDLMQQPASQTPPAPEPLPEPAPEPAPAPVTEEELNAPFDDTVPPAAANDDLFAPLPDSMPPANADLYRPFDGSGGADGASGSW